MITVYYLPVKPVTFQKKRQGIVRSQGLNMDRVGRTDARNVVVPWNLRNKKQRNSFNNGYRTFCPVTCPYVGQRQMNAEREWYTCFLNERAVEWDTCLKCDAFSCDDEEILT